MRFHLPQTTVAPLKLIRRERTLPAPGKIVVQEGERVDPVQVIGIAMAPGSFHIVNVAESLGVSTRTAQRYVKVEIGQQVKKGDILALRRLPSKRVCRSPIDGQVTGGGGGRLLIEGAPQDVEVRAGYYGTVERVHANLGVTIRIAGAVIQGAWGNGQEGFGVLRVTVKGRDKPLRARTVDPASRGAILVGGNRLDDQALERAVELQVRGIIVGGLPPELLDQVQKLPFPVVATEGIGTIPMSAHIFDLLTTQDGREAILDGRFKSGWERERPEIIIPLPAEPGTDQLQLVEAPLQVGNRVRAIRHPHIGTIGTVLALPETAMRTATGARLMVAQVKPDEGGEPLFIPLVNLEVLR